LTKRAKIIRAIAIVRDSAAREKRMEGVIGLGAQSLRSKSGELSNGEAAAHHLRITNQTISRMITIRIPISSM